MDAPILLSAHAARMIRLWREAPAVARTAVTSLLTRTMNEVGATIPDESPVDDPRRDTWGAWAAARYVLHVLVGNEAAPSLDRLLAEAREAMIAVGHHRVVAAREEPEALETQVVRWAYHLAGTVCTTDEELDKARRAMRHVSLLYLAVTSGTARPSVDLLLDATYAALQAAGRPSPVVTEHPRQVLACMFQLGEELWASPDKRVLIEAFRALCTLFLAVTEEGSMPAEPPTAAENLQAAPAAHGWNMEALTPRQQMIYAWIRDYIGREGRSPTQREIALAHDINQGTVYGYLQALARKGAITLGEGATRAITLTQAGPRQRGAAR